MGFAGVAGMDNVSWVSAANLPGDCVGAMNFIL
jgi:hypothetical protein